MLAQLSNFERLHSLGYARLVPIIPPDAEISVRSSLYKRVGTPQDSRGKAVGVRGSDGKWFGFDWIKYDSDTNDLARWGAMGAGVGIKTGMGLIAIDADTMDADHARTIRDVIEDRLGLLPTRIGRFPKSLYVCRVSEDFRYSRIEFGPRDARGNAERVEILSDGRQFVAEGVHPTTHNPYSWPRALCPYGELPVFTAAQIEGVLSALRGLLPASTEIIREGAVTEVSQEALRGSVEHVRKAVAATPNTSALFPSRESYRDMGYAIKAALPDDEAEALEIFQDWCAKWVDGDNDPDVVEADWRRMKPPYRRGAGWLYELAEKTASPDAGFTQADVWFEPIAENKSPFDAQNDLNAFREGEAAQSDVYPLLTIDDLMQRPPPTFLLARHIPNVSFGFLYSEPGAGKSFLALDIGLSIAHGLEAWHGDALSCDPESVVIYIASEGSFDLKNRIAAWRTAHAVTGFSKRFLVIEKTINFLVAEDVARLLRTVASVGRRPALVVVDTVSRAMPGADENLQKDMTVFVRACDLVRDRWQCAVVGVHHSAKGSGLMRGSGVLQGAGDFVFRLERKKGASIGTLVCEKQKAAPDGWEEAYHLDVVRLCDGQSSLVPSRVESGASGGAADRSAAPADVVLEAMRAAWEAGAPWSDKAQTGDRSAIRRMVSDYGFKAADAENMLAVWSASGFIRMDTLSSKTKKKGFKVLVAHCEPDKLSDKLSVFD